MNMKSRFAIFGSALVISCLGIILLEVRGDTTICNSKCRLLQCTDEIPCRWCGDLDPLTNLPICVKGSGLSACFCSLPINPNDTCLQTSMSFPCDVTIGLPTVFPPGGGPPVCTPAHCPTGTTQMGTCSLTGVCTVGCT